MTIDEAIAMMHEWADYECYNEEQIQASEAFNQIAVLLEELKAYRTLDKTNFSDEYNRAIDDLRNELKNHYTEYNIDCVLTDTSFYSYTTACNYLEDYIDEIAEQLKAGEAE